MNGMSMRISYPLTLLTLVALLAGCSVFGSSGVEIAPYRVIERDDAQNIELRHYEQLILVSAPMGGDMDARKNAPFSKLFDYISGNNVSNTEVPMTAPVLLSAETDDKGTKIPMTAPVFLEADGSSGSMSFVLPASYTLATTPKPLDPQLEISGISDVTYAVIQFSGFLNASNIERHRELLDKWIDSKGLETIGPYKAAGYNPPFTIPALRRNEVLIPVKHP